MNAFQLFDLEPAPRVDAAQIQEKYHALAGQSHPDQGGDKSEFEKITRAYGILRSPALVIKHYLEICGADYDARGAVGNELMDLFMQVGSLLQRVDEFIRRKQSASSALAKALLEAESMALQEKISQCIETVERAEQAQLAEIDAYDLPQAARNLAFLEKWRGQLRQRFAGLF